MQGTSTSNSTLQFARNALTRGFFFMSPWRSLATQGCFASVSVPAHGGEFLASNFQQHIFRQLAVAKQQGIARPVIVGAIPFNTRQPSSLFIPETCHFFDRIDFMRQMPLQALKENEIMQCREVPGQSEFMQMVMQAVAATLSGRLHKVVLSRLIDIITREPVDTANLIAQLVAQNPDSYHFRTPLASGESLVGASPELLLRMSDNRYYTYPLAGSARRECDPERDRAVGQRLLHSAKDRYEHQLVVDAIRERLQSQSRALIIPSSPQLLTTGTLWHLGTLIEGEIVDSCATALSLACLLHPTPALSGFPHHAAAGLIAELEPFDRGPFGGIVGWCDAEGNGEWAVTIRCGKFSNDHACLFAGAGIVSDSEPESEWCETKAKLDTMMRAMGLNKSLKHQKTTGTP